MELVYVAVFCSNIYNEIQQEIDDVIDEQTTCCSLEKRLARFSVCCLHLIFFSFIDCRRTSSSVYHSINASYLVLYCILGRVKLFRFWCTQVLTHRTTQYTVLCALVCLSADFVLHCFVARSWRLQPQAVFHVRHRIRTSQY